jgi:hypothetical protein
MWAGRAHSRYPFVPRPRTEITETVLPLSVRPRTPPEGPPDTARETSPAHVLLAHHSSTMLPRVCEAANVHAPGANASSGESMRAIRSWSHVGVNRVRQAGNENLAPADTGCNAAKRDFLAPTEHVGHSMAQQSPDTTATSSPRASPRVRPSVRSRPAPGRHPTSL